MRYRIWFLVVAVVLLTCVYSYADVPKMMNFQGRLTDASGKFVPDGNYSLTFRIYSDSTGGSAKWSEGQLIALSKGLFNVILGSVNPIPDSIFNYANTYLGIQVGTDPEMTPRQRLSSLGYSYRTAKADTSSYSMNSDKLDGLDASAFASVSTDYGRSGVATDLYEGTTRLIDKYLQQGQASSVNSSMIVDSTITNADISASANISPSKISGTAWTSTNDGSGSGLDADLLDGQHGSYYTNAANISNGTLADGRLSTNVDLLNAAQIFTGVKTFNPSSGSVPFAVDASKNGAVANLNADLLDGQHASAFVSTSADYGRSGVAADLYEGTSTLSSKYVHKIGPDSVVSTSSTAFLGKSKGSSTSAVFGIQGYADNSSTGPSYGVYGTGLNSSTGQAFGGYFTTWPVTGSGWRYGVYSQGAGSSSYPTYAYYADASNSGSGDTYGGFFITSSSGTGTHYGTRADCYSAGSANTFGSYGKASNSSNSYTYGGFFVSDSAGTGIHYGARAEGYSSSSANTYGSYGFGYNSSYGNVYGGYFQTSSAGTGPHYGVYGEGYSASSSPAYGSYGEATGTSTGLAYGGSFKTNYSGTGTHYGVSGIGYASSSAPVYGCDGLAENTSNGFAYGGHFKADSAGTGIHYGVYGEGYASNNYTGADGVYGYAENSGAGGATGGTFQAFASGGGSYGIYSSSDNSGGSGSSTAIYTVATGSVTGEATGGEFHAYTGGFAPHYGIRAYGEGDQNAPNYGCWAEGYCSSTGNVYGGYFVADSAGSGVGYGIYSQASIAYWAGWFQGDIGVSHNSYVYGNSYVSGTKSAAVKVENGEYRAMYSQESPENWFEDFGEGQLANGKTHIELDQIFLQTVTIDNLHPMKVFVQLEGDCNGVFVTKGTTGFDVSELKGGVANAAFSYRVVAKRKGYEDLRLAKIVGKTAEVMALEQAKNQTEFARERAQREEEQKKMEQQRLEKERNMNIMK